MSSLKKIAEEVKLDVKLVRDVLKEVPGVKVSKTVADRIFATARRLGYDLKKLKIGKRMAYRRETLEEVLQRVSENTAWGRDEILKYLNDALGMIERVQKRTFQDEYGDDWL
jgi:transcriptional regulator GlxA family with amidase domain